MPFSDEKRGSLVPVAEGLLRLRPVVALAAVSPDGRYVAWTPSGSANSADIVVTDVATGDEVVRLTGAAAAERLVWCGPERLLVVRGAAARSSRAAVHEMPDGGVVGECALPFPVSELDPVETSRDGRLVCFHNMTHEPLGSHTRSLPELTQVGDAMRGGRGRVSGTGVALHPDGHEIACVSYAVERTRLAFLSTRDGAERRFAVLPDRCDADEPAWVGPRRLALTTRGEVPDTVLIHRQDMDGEVAVETVAQLVGQRSFRFERLAVSTAQPALLGAVYADQSREVRAFAVVDVDARAVLARGRCPPGLYGHHAGCFNGRGAAVVAVPTTRGTAVMLLDRGAARMLELAASRLAAGVLLKGALPADFIPLLEPTRPLMTYEPGAASRLFLLSTGALRARGKAVGP